MQALDEIRAFLGAETPSAWVQAALQQQSILLIDHANCEKKAAATALNLLFRYPQHDRLSHRLSRLAREELRHFEQVAALMKKRGIAYEHLSSARYASGLRDCVRTHEPAKLVDILIVGAFIEARSCERFAALAPHLDDDLRRFYESLLQSEARHYQDYLALAREYAQEPIEPHIARIRARETELIVTPDAEFRFHSGVPAGQAA